MYSDSLYRQPPAENIFSRANLRLTFTLLRDPSPSLALTIQNLLIKAEHAGTIDPVEDSFALDLPAETVAAIVEQLADIGVKASRDTDFSKQELTSLRCLLMDWMLYAQSFEKEPVGAKDESHQQQP